MKHNLIYILSTFIFFSCGLLEKTSDCDENLEFKRKFFQNIDNVENNISIKQDSMFITSLSFISKYSRVSFEDMNNYANIYPIATFKKDKQVWLQWYENNRCSNIELNSSDD